MRKPQLQANWVTCSSGGLGSRGNTCSLAHSTQQGLESIRKQLDTVNHQLVRYFFHGESGLCQIGHGLGGAFHVFAEAWPKPSAVAECVECRGVYRVDGL